MQIDTETTVDTTAADTDTTTDTDTQTEDTTTSKDTTDTTKDTKPQETDEQKLARYERQAKQLRKKLGKETDTSTDKTTKKSKTSEFDYGQKAFLIANGIKGADEMQLAREVMEETGKSDLEALVESKYFQARLKEFREDAAAEAAMPKGTRKTAATSKDSVEYWIAKGELPPDTPENTELRRKVVNAKQQKATSGSKFTSHAVVK